MANSNETLESALDKDYVRESSSEDEVYVCVLCNKAGRREMIITHLKTKEHEERVTFEEGALPERKLDKAIITGDVKKQDDYHCVVCDAEFKTRETAKKHLDSGKHSKALQDKQRGILQADIDSGYITKPATKSDPYTCTLCGLDRKNETTILEHLNSTKHQTEKLAKVFAETLNTANED